MDFVNLPRGGKIGSTRWASPVRPKLGSGWAIKLLARKKPGQIWPGPVLVQPTVGPARPARLPPLITFQTMLKEIVLAYTTISLICTLSDNALLVSCTLVVNPCTLIRTTCNVERRFSHQIVAMANPGSQLETIRLELCLF